jgi:hypothetical protein
LERGFEKYYASIRRRDLPPKYYDLRDRIVDLLYPEFQRNIRTMNKKTAHEYHIRLINFKILLLEGTKLKMALRERPS